MNTPSEKCNVFDTFNNKSNLQYYSNYNILRDITPFRKIFSNSLNLFKKTNTRINNTIKITPAKSIFNSSNNIGTSKATKGDQTNSSVKVQRLDLNFNNNINVNNMNISIINDQRYNKFIY